MNDLQRQLAKSYEPTTRFASFGAVIERIRIHGFRGHADTLVQLDYPVTAICGANGSGKSTILELASCCYSNTAGTDFAVRDYFPKGVIDTEPFASDASVEVAFAQQSTNPESRSQVLTIARDGDDTRWRGYDRRPQKNVLFCSQGRHVPRSDRSDPLRRIAENAVLDGETAVSADVCSRASRILGISYSSLREATISYKTDKANAIVVGREAGASYSELQMGCGEARVLALVHALETAAKKSLVLLEEPESAVHLAAQGRLGEYLLDVAQRRRHQILVATHSEYVVRTLPNSARVFLHRTSDGIEVLRGLSPAEVASLMSDGHERALTIVVEDEVAAQVLRAILNHYGKALLQSSKIVVGGFVRSGERGGVESSGHSAIRNALAAISGARAPIAAVLDGDQEERRDLFVYKLPGSQAPEEELFKSTAVRELWEREYQLDVAEFVATLPTDCHLWFSHLSRKVNAVEAYLVGQAADAYAKSLVGTEPRILVENLREAVGRK